MKKLWVLLFVLLLVMPVISARQAYRYDQDNLVSRQSYYPSVYAKYHYPNYHPNYYYYHDGRINRDYYSRYTHLRRYDHGRSHVVPLYRVQRTDQGSQIVYISYS